jgi:hypothetical protein
MMGVSRKPVMAFSAFPRGASREEVEEAFGPEEEFEGDWTGSGRSPGLTRR